MDPISALAEKLMRLPGIGPRQARRIAYALLALGPAVSRELALAITRLGDETAQCERCYRFFPASAQAKQALCSECSDTGRDASIVLIVERDTDLDAIRKSGTYEGRFFVLGGNIPILESDPAKKIRIKELLAEVTRAAREDGLHEIIIATSANEEGEYTAQYVTKTLEPTTLPAQIVITSLGRGLSTGAELEYADKETLRNALKNRG
ncbi:MAG: hypothetical protein A2408_01545 [Candidatus Yonathbacteria bacterium RIFOXYC1_FULL_52_10]|uniref:Recombination protein RecR n=1 Tax=Candidatus Yonathbacteria bacterium RIFOXYD1_FULL_52_36 TaxID=1802730 RepID=A0A1G2SKZ2_9BACT|nr:MAG: hypothetical protein A2408_01545 [Candidatus Yonathbacteria bacterium RIFOXYC1_FULL_52_10]OHA85755.1 MAG: hypothetical protein A2591_02715 [Candidatus Yonathbacteria bacterium RIFOXYD1_FULL_52_36]